MEWTQYNGVGSRETLFKKYSVNCLEGYSIKLIILIFTEDDIMEHKNYYVYERIRLDDMSCFYVGKGKGERYRVASRNEHHDRVAKKYGYKTIIVKSNLSEQEALNLEKERIHYYVFELKYGIDIEGYRKSSCGHFLTNQTFGGYGALGTRHTEEWKAEHSRKMSGKGNPMYGINMFANLPTEKQDELRRLWSERYAGEHNPMYGIPPRERMSPEKYTVWLKKLKGRDYFGSNNPNFGNKTLHNKVKDNPELRLQYYSRPKERNGRAREIYVYDCDGNLINHFDYIGACSEWFKDFLKLQTNPNSIRQSIITSITNNKTYYNYKFCYTQI